MGLGIVGKKSGMTRIFDGAGQSIPVTVIEVQPNHITQLKTLENDRYQAVQVTTGALREKRVSKPLAGHLAKSDASPGRGLWEFRLKGEEELDIGGELSLDQFFAGQIVDVSGISKGKGFAGVVKRWNFQRQDMSHGNSKAHRAPGSIGQCQTPGKVFKGKKMAGQMGNKKVTVQNLEVVKVDQDHNLLLVKGGVPGPTGGNVIVKPAVKRGVQQLPEDGDAAVGEE